MLCGSGDNFINVDNRKNTCTSSSEKLLTCASQNFDWSAFGFDLFEPNRAVVVSSKLVSSVDGDMDNRWQNDESTSEFMEFGILKSST